MSRSSKQERELQLLTQKGLVDKSGIRIGSDAVKLKRKPAAIADHRQLFRDYEELHDLRGPGTQDLASDRSDMLKSKSAGSQYKAAVTPVDKRLRQQWLITKDEKANGWVGNYDRLYKTAAESQNNLGILPGRNGSRIANAAWRFIPGAAGKFVASVGSAGGAVIDLISPTETLTYSNWLMNLGKGIEKTVEDATPIYNRESFEESTSLYGKMNHAEFWTQDVADGLEFVASNLVGGFAVKGAKGALMAAKAARTGKAAVQAGSKGFNAILSNMGFASAMTMGEAGQEGAEMYASIKQKLRGQINPATKQEYTQEEIEQKAQLGADAVWKGNMAVLMPSNMLMAKFLFAPGAVAKASVNSQARMVNKMLMGQGGVKSTYAGQIGKKVGAGFLSEGLWEENIQLSISRASEKYALHGDKDWYKNVRTEAIRNVASYIKGVTGGSLNQHEMESAMSILIGGIIGKGMGIKDGVKTHRDRMKQSENLQNLVDALNTDAGAAKGLFAEDFATILNGEFDESGMFQPKLDDKGELSVNMDAAQNLFYRRLYDEMLAEEMTKAAVKGDKFHLESTRDLALARMMHGLASIESSREVKGWNPFRKSNHEGMAQKLFNEQATEMAEMFGEGNNPGVQEAGKKYLEMWNKINSETKITDITSGLTTAGFENIYKKVKFYNAVRLDTYNRMLGEAQDSGNTEMATQLEALIQDTETYMNNLTKNKKDAAKRWEEELKGPRDKRNKIKEIDKKLTDVKDPAERSKLEDEKELLMYELSENVAIHGKSVEGGLAVPHAKGAHNTTELSIAEHESVDNKNTLGIKHAHFFKMGHSAIGQEVMDDAMSKIQDMSKELQDPNKTPEEKANLIKEIDAQRRDLANIIRNNSKNATPEMQATIQELEQSSRDIVTQSKDTVQKIEQALKTMREKLAKLQERLNSLGGKSKTYQRESSEALIAMAEYIPGLDSYVGVTADQLRDELNKLTPEDRDNRIAHIVEQMEQAVQNDPMVQTIIDMMIEDVGEELAKDNPGVGSIQLISLGLKGLQSTPEIVKLEQDIQAAKDEIQELEKDLDSARKELQKNEAFLNNHVLPAGDAVENGFDTSKELLDNKDNDNFWRRKAANLPLERVENLANNANANRNAFTDRNSVDSLRSDLQQMERIFNKREAIGEDGLMKDTTEFKGYMQSLKDALKVLDDLADLANENQGKRDAKQQEVLDNIARRDLGILGLEVDSKGEILVRDSKLWAIITTALGDNVIQAIWASTENLTEKGIGARIILEKLKASEANYQAKIRNHVNTAQTKTKKILQSRALKGELNLHAPTMDDSYFFNPDRLFDKYLLNMYREEARNLYEDPTLIDKNPFFIFEESKDLLELEINMENSLFSDELKSQFKELLEIHKQLSGYRNLLDSMDSEYSYAEQFMSEDAILSAIASRPDAAKDKHVPTIEQLVAIRQILNHFHNVSNVDLKLRKAQVASYLRGIPGTGKTSMVLKWVADILKLESDKMYAFSHNEKSSKGIASSIGSTEGSLNNFLSEDLDGIELLVIDEIGFFGQKDSEAISKKISVINSKRKAAKQKPLAVIVLGDPSQITVSARPSIEEPYFMRDLRIINPLTQSYRSNVQSISNLFKIFQRNPTKVENVTVTANQHVGTPWDSNNKLVGAHAGASSNELIGQLINMKDSGRSKVVIVNTETDKGKYTNNPEVQDMMNKGNLEVLTYDKSQGQTFDEVYIDLNPMGNNLRGKPFMDNKTSLQFNQAMYTAVSRAKYYTFVVDPTFKNVQDDKVNDNQQQADLEMEEAFNNYTDRHDREKTLMSEHLFSDEQKNNLNTINKTPTPPGSNPPGKNPPSSTVQTVDDTQDPTNEPLESETVIDMSDLNEDLSKPEDIDEQSTKNTKVIGDPVDMKDEQEAVKDGNEVLDITNPEYINLKAPEEDGTVPEGAPVVLVKVARNGVNQTLYLGQVFRDNEWKEEWRELGTMSNKDRNSKIYKDKVKAKEDDFQTNGETPARYNNVELKAIKKAIAYGRDGKAIVDQNKTSKIVGVATMQASNTLSYRYKESDQPTTYGGAINKLLSLFNNVFGNVADVTKSARVKIFTEADRKEIASKGSSYGKFSPKAGVPYLIVTVKGKDQYVRLTPRKLNRTDMQKGHYKALDDTIRALRALKNKFAGTKFEDINLGDQAFNVLMRKLRKNFKRDASTGKPVYDAHNYGLKEIQDEITKGIAPELAPFKDMTQNEYDLFVEAAKTVVPSFYRYTMQTIQFRSKEMLDHMSSNPSDEFMTMKEAGLGQREDIFVLVQDDTAQGDERFYRDYELAAGKGGAQVALNSLARSHTKDDIFNYRVKRFIGGKQIAMAKSLLAEQDNLNSDQYIITLRKYAMEYMRQSGKYTEDQIQAVQRFKGQNKIVGAIKSAAATMGIPQQDVADQIEATKEDHRTNPITLEGLEKLFGDSAFDPKTGEHAGENAYLALPLARNTIKDKNGGVAVQGVNELGENLTPENNSKLESMMGTRIDTIAPTSVQLNFGKPTKSDKNPLIPATDTEIEIWAQEVMDIGKFNSRTLSQEDINKVKTRVKELKAEQKAEEIRKQKELAEKQALIEEQLRLENEAMETKDRYDNTLIRFERNGIKLEDHPDIIQAANELRYEDAVKLMETTIDQYVKRKKAELENMEKALLEEIDQKFSISGTGFGFKHWGGPKNLSKDLRDSRSLKDRNGKQIPQIAGEIPTAYTSNSGNTVRGNFYQLETNPDGSISYILAVTRDRQGNRLTDYHNRPGYFAVGFTLPERSSLSATQIQDLLIDKAASVYKKAVTGTKIQNLNLGTPKPEPKDKVSKTFDFGEGYGKFRLVDRGGELVYQTEFEGTWEDVSDEWFEDTQAMYEDDKMNGRNLEGGLPDGPSITLKNARKLAKTYLPGLRIEGDSTWLQKMAQSLLGRSNDNAVVVKFVTKEVLDSMAKPGENLFGLYKDGVAYILKEKDASGKWTVKKETVKHEIFHKIFNEYLTPQERRKVRLATQRHLNRTDLLDMHPIEFEEVLANEFQKYQTDKKAFKGRLANLFYNISKWFGFVQENENDLVRLFDAIQAGRFRKGTQLYPDYVGRRTLRDINKLFGDVNNMKDMISEVRMLYHGVLNNAKAAYSMEDVYGVVVNRIAKDAARYEELSSKGDEMISEAEQELTNFTELLNKLKATKADESEVKAVEKKVRMAKMIVRRLQGQVKRAKSKQRVYSKLGARNKNERLESFEVIAEWLFPSWDFGSNKEAVKFGEIDLETVAEDTDAVVEEIMENFNLQEVIQDRDKVNQESKLSTAVKLFLGSVSFNKLDRKTGKTREVYMTGRAAFVKMLDLLETITFSSVKDFKTQFTEAALEAAGAESITDVNFRSGIIAGLHKKIIDLYETAEGDSYYSEELDDDIVLAPESFFFNDQIFVTAKDISDLKGDKLKGADLAQLEAWEKDGKIALHHKSAIIEALQKGNPDAFLTTDHFVQEVARKAGLTKADAVALFKQQEAQNTLAEMYSHMGSLREKRVKIAEVENEFGVKKVRYIYTGQGLTMKNSLRSTIDDSVETFIERLVDSNRGYFKDEPIFEERNVNGKKVKVQVGLNSAQAKAYEHWHTNSFPEIKAKLKSTDPKQAAEGIRMLLKELGLNDLANQPLPRTTAVGSVATDLSYFFDTYMKGSKVSSKGKARKNEILGVGHTTRVSKKDSILEGFQETDNYIIRSAKDVLDDEGSVFDSLVKLIEFNEEWIRATSMRNSKGDTVFYKTQSTQADDILNTLSKMFKSDAFKGSRGSRKTLRLPPHLRTSFFKSNIFVQGINTIYGIVDHDGFKDKRTGRSTPYSRESELDWYSRNFNAAFISTIRGSVSGSPRYDQSVYTTSNRPNIRHVNMDVLGYKGIMKSLEAYIDQVSNRPYSLLEKINGEKNEDGIKNFSLGKHTNFEVFEKAVKSLGLGDLLTDLEGLKTLKDKPAAKDKIRNAMFDVLDEQSKEVAQHMIDMKFEVTSDINKAILKLHDVMPEMFMGLKESEQVTFAGSEGSVKTLNKEKEFKLNKTKLENIVRIWYMNNYVNSYNLNQLVAGDSNFFKNSLDQVKRMSGVFAPGLKGLVHPKLGMREKFRAAVMADVEGDSAHIKDFLSRLLSNEFTSFEALETQAKEIAKQEAAGKTLSARQKEVAKYYQDINEMIVKFGKDYEYTDAQGFITPARAAQIAKGFGRAYGAGRVFKGAHYENLVKTDPEGNEVSHPFMMKYSSVVLSDELVERFEPLKRLRDAMENAEGGAIDEAIFQSGTKVGKPNVMTSGKAIEDGTSTGFNEKSVYSLSNENFRLQSNPDHIAGDHGKGVANPTQLGYFLNVMQNLVTDSFNGSAVVYEHVSKLIEEGASEFLENYKDKSGNYSQQAMAARVKGLLQGKGNERLLELVEAGVDFNAPHIVNKILTQVAAGLASDSVKIRFPGEKLTLQSAYGIQYTTGKSIKDITGFDNNKARHLQYYVNEQGHMVAEVVVPSGSLPKSIMEKLKNGEDVYMHADAMGFRIPSTELHSAVALKIVDTYDSRGSSMVIAPRELVPLHGSDFDVDSLFILTRNHSHLTENEQGLLDNLNVNDADPNSRFWHESFAPDAPIGYRKGKHVQWVLDAKFPAKIDEAIKVIEERVGLDTNSKEDRKLYKGQLKLLKKLRKQYYQNIILETFLKATTHPENRARMLSPITMEMFSGGLDKKTGLYAKGTIFRMLQDLNIKKAERSLDGVEEDPTNLQKKVDLSDVRGNYEVYKSNMEGAALTGVFANAIKAMAYMLHSGGANQGVVTQQIEAAEESLKDSKKVLGKLKKRLETAEKRKEKATTPVDIKTTTAVVDELNKDIKAQEKDINSLEESLKTLKTQAKNLETSNRPTLNVSGNNKDAGIRINGSEYTQMSEYTDDPNLGITNQPIWEVMDSLVNAAIDNVKEQILPIINANGLTANAISAMITLGIPTSTIVLMTNHPIIKGLDSTKFKTQAVKDAKEAIAKSMAGGEMAAYYRKPDGTKMSFEEIVDNLDSLAEHVEVNDEMLKAAYVAPEFQGDLQNYAVLREFEKVLKIGEDLATLSSALDVVRQAPAFKEDLDTLQSKWDDIASENEDGVMEFNDKFSWRIPDLFKMNPHIKTAYKYIVKEFSDLVSKSFIQYDPSLQKALYSSYNRVKIKLHNKSSKSKVMYVQEFMKYLISSIPSLNKPEIHKAKYEYVNISGKLKTKEGHQAWSQQVLNKMSELKGHKNLKNNRFVQSLDISTNRYSRLKGIRFAAGSNLEYHDNLELQDAFLELFEYSFNENGELIHNPDLKGSFENFNDLQKEFAEFAIINFGLRFSSQNFSMALPGQLIKPYVDEFTKASKRYISKESKLNPSVSEDGEYARLFEDFIEHFEIEAALNHADSLPYIPSSYEPKKTRKKLIEGGKAIVVDRNQGINEDSGTYYDLAYYTTERDISDFPKFISKTHFKTNQQIVYIKVESDSVDMVMYQKVGYGKKSASYQMPEEVSKNGYILEEHFHGEVPSIGVDNLDDTNVKIPDYLDSPGLEGTIVQLYHWDDVARLNPKFVRITKVDPTLSEVKREDDFVWKDIVVQVEEVTNEELKEQHPEAANIELKKRKKGDFDPLALGGLDSFMAGDTHFANVKDGDRHNAKEEIERIAKSDSSYGVLAQSYLDTFGDILDNWEIHYSSSEIKRVMGEGFAGFFQPTGGETSRIVVGNGLGSGQTAETILHEVAHGLTVAILRLAPHKLTKEQRLARARLRSTYKAFKKRIKKTRPDLYKDRTINYRLKNIDEFVAGVYSDPNFQQLLHEYESTDIHDNKPSFLQKVWDNVMKMLGISNDSSSLLVDTFATISVLIGDGSLITKYSDQLRDQRFGNVNNLANDTTNKLTQKSGKIEVGMDSEGNQLDFYTVEGEKRNRVSDQNTGWLSKVLKRAKDEVAKHWIEVKADRVFKGLAEDAEVFIDKAIHTRDSYIELLKDFERKGLAKGNIIHKMMEIALHNNLSNKTPEELNKELGELRATSTIKGAHLAFEWVWSALPNILERVGINTLSKDENLAPEDRDLAIPELAIESETLDFAGTIDTMFQHKDGSYTLLDWKTGRSFEKEAMYELFKYGDSFQLMYDNPVNKAKMQLMFYAFMMKVENPGMKFRDLVAVHAPNKHLAGGDNAIKRVEIAPYLEIIQNYYKNEDFKKYQEILDKSPNAFKVDEYNGTNAKVVDRFKNPKHSTEDNLKAMQNHIKWIVQANLDKNKMSKEDQERLETLFSDYMNMSHESGYKVDNWTEDISWMSHYVGNYSNIDHPAIKIWKKELDVAKAKMRAEIDPKVNKFRRLLRPVYAEYLKNSGRWQDSIAKVTPEVIRKNMGYADYDKLYKTLMKQEKVKGQNVWRLIHKNDDEWSDGKLSDSQKNLLEYVNQSFGEYFDPSTGFMNENALVRENGNEISNLELFNQQKQGKDKFTYYEGFLPIIPPSANDVMMRKGNYLQKGKNMLKHWYLKNLTEYYENNYELWEDGNQAIPLKYLGSAEQRANEYHSFNLEDIFEKFTRAAITKKHGDHVHAIGRTMQSMISTKPKDSMKKLDSWLDAQMNIQLLNKKGGMTGRVTKKGIRGLIIDGKETELNFGKILKTISNYTSSTVMWFKVRGGLQNGAGAMGVAWKRALSHSIAKRLKFLGIEASDVELSLKDMAKGSWEGGIRDSFYKDSITGNLDNNKTWQLMKHMNYMPDMNEFYKNSKESLTSRANLFTTDTAYMFHSLPEEMVAASTMVALMNSMKLDEPYKLPSGKMAKTMWDCYSVEKVEHSDGTIETNLQYNGPTRGKVMAKDGSFTDLKGLTVDEVSKLKYIYQEMQGAYRPEERTILHNTYLGEAFLKFKRYMPTMLKEGLKSKGHYRDAGSYVPVLDDKGKPMVKDGQTVMQWQEGVMEGRWWVMGKVLSNWLGTATRIQALKNDEYKINNLSKKDKLNLVEGFTTILSMIGVSLGLAALGFDEDDPVYLALNTAASTMNQQYNLIEIAKNSLSNRSQFAGINKSWQLIDSISKFGFAAFLHWTAGMGGMYDESDITTADGEYYQGTRDLIKSIPGLSLIYTNGMDWSRLQKYHGEAVFRK